MPKASNIWHVTLLTELLDHSKPDLSDLITTAAPHFKTMLSSENFKATANYSQILSLIGFFCSASTYTKDKSYVQWMVQHDAIRDYVATIKGFVNTIGYFQKGPSIYEVKNHMKAIEKFIIWHYQEHNLPGGDNTFRDTLCEYLLN